MRSTYKQFYYINRGRVKANNRSVSSGVGSNVILDKI